MNFFGLATVLLIFSTLLHAQQLNERKYVPPDAAATIQKYTAGGGSMGADLVDPSLVNIRRGKNCEVNIGNIDTPVSGQKAETKVVVKGPVINVCK